MSDAYSKLEPHRAEIEEARRGGMSWDDLGKLYAVRPESVRDWCSGWMDVELMKSLRLGSGAAKAKSNKCLKTANQRFAEAMAGARFDDVRVNDGGVYRIDRPTTHVITAANS